MRRQSEHESVKRSLFFNLKVLGIGPMLLFLILVISGAWLGLNYSENLARTRVGQLLEVVAETTDESLQEWFEAESENAQGLASDLDWLPYVEQQLAVPRDNDSLRQASSFQLLKQHLAAQDREYGKMDVLLIAPDLRTIFSSRDIELGEPNRISQKRPQSLQGAFDGLTVFVPPIHSKRRNAQDFDSLPVMFVATPINNIQGETIAVLAVRHNPAEDFTRLCQLGRVGATGETYAFDKQGLLISESRFDMDLAAFGLLEGAKDAILSIRISDPGGALGEGYRPALKQSDQPLTEMARQAVRGESGVNTRGYRDYRGVRVIGAWIWDTELNIGLASEVDEAEALALYYVNRTIIVIILAITVVLALLLSVFTIWSSERSKRALKEKRDEWEQVAEARTAELRQREEKFRAIFDQTVQLMAVLDIDGLLQESNRAARDIIAVSEESLVGAPFWEAPWWAHSKDLQTQLKQAIQQAAAGRTVQLEVEHPDSQGLVHNVDFSISPVMSQHGAVDFLLALGHDITERKIMEKELREREKRFLTLVNNIPGVVYQCLSQEPWSMLFISEEIERLTGYPAADFMGNSPARNFVELMHPEDRAMVAENTARALAAHEPYIHEYRIIDKDGSLHYVYARGQASYDEYGQSTHLDGTIFDISEKKLAELAMLEAEERSRLLLESAGEGIFGTDGQGLVTFVNPAATRMLGYEAPEMLGKTIHDMVHYAHSDGADYPLEECPMWRAYTQGAREEIDNEVLWRKDGSSFDVRYISTPVYKEGSLVGSVITFSDITQQKIAEEELRTAKHAAESATHAKSDFLANMSHEIRTPMNGIIGMTELALDTELTQEQRDYLNTVKTSADSLLTLINDILDFSKIEAGKLELDPIDFALRDSLADMLNTLASRAHSKGLELTYEVAPDAPEGLLGDVHRLRQIIVNLVGNAVKFTAKGEIVVGVAVEAQDEESVHLHFTVRDTGIGIAQDKLEAVFAPFEQADTSTTRNFGGTGLGLAISVQLTELMGGRIWAESVEGQGSTFQFTAKFGYGKVLSAKDLSLQCDMLEGLRVLIVDDNATNRRILEDMLRNWRMMPQSTGEGAEALAELDRATNAGDAFQLVLSDVNMPGMDGFTLFEGARANARHETVPFILLTSASRPGDVAHCREIGVAAHLIKPVKQSLLLNTIANVMLGNSAQTSRQAKAPVTPEALDPERSLRFLLAEDNLINQKYAIRAIEKAGHTIEVTNNGEEAVEAWKAGAYDVVLMDIQMPVMDGFEATAEIRRLEEEGLKQAPTPIIAMTANAMKGDKERCLEAGMSGYISKPVKRKTLFEEVARVLTQS